MATTSSDGHQQSIGADNDQPVDGIAGSHAGTQEPGGAHVDAGAIAPGPQRRPPPVPEKPGVKPSGNDGQGVAQPADVSGAMGPHSKDRSRLVRRRGDLMCYRGYNGSLARGGEIIGVVVGCGALSPASS
jgi:hypothetical protein